MRPLFRFPQIETSPADNHLMAMIHERLDQVFQVQQFRTAIYQGDIVDAERRLQSRQLI